MFRFMNFIFGALFDSLRLFTWVFDYVIRFLYNICGSYTMSLFLFALLSRLLMLPFDYKIILNQRRMTLIADKLEAARKAGKGDSAAIQKNRMAVFDEEGINPSSTGWIKFLRVYLMMGIIRVIYTPITSILKVADSVREEASGITSHLLEGTSRATSYPADMTILGKVMSDPDAFSGVSGGFLEKAEHLNDGFTLLGVNLATVPTGLSDLSGWMFFAACLPFIYCVLMFLNRVYYRKKYNAKFTLNDFCIPLYMLFLSVNLPLATSFYWTCGLLISFVFTFVMDLILNPDRVKALHEKKKASFVPPKRRHNAFIDGIRYDVHKMYTASMGGKIAGEDEKKSKK